MRGKNRKVDRTRRGLAATAIGALTVTGIGFVPPAAATLGDGSDLLPADVNVTVFHNVDFINTSGWGSGELLTIDVLRNGVVIGGVSANAVDVEGSPGLEVNHGVDGTPGAGDCWTGHTPDIRPGDTIRIQHDAGTSNIIVDNITLPGPATYNPATRDVEVRGVAQRADGTAIPPDFLDSGEFRDVLPDGAFRATPQVVADPSSSVPGAFVMRYAWPYNGDVKHPDDSTTEERRQSLLTTDGHAIGFGHVDPLPVESMLVEGFGDAPGPALGCEASIAAIDRVNTISDDTLNAADLAGPGDVTITGEAFDSTSVMVTVGTLAPRAATLAGAAGGPRTWSLSVPRSDLAAGLLDGTHAVTMTSQRTGAPGPISGVGSSLVKDVVAPNAPTATPAASTFVGSANVALSAGAGDTIRYTVGDGSQAAPTANTGAVYSGAFLITQTANVKAIAVDGVGNVSPVMSRTFTRTVPPVVTPPPGSGAAVLPLAPSIAKAKSGKRGGVKTAKARWRAPQANGAVVDGYRVRALKIRPGKSAKRVKAVRIDANKTRLKMVLPRGAYKFQVRAISDAGKSPWSKRSNKVRSR